MKFRVQVLQTHRDTIILKHRVFLNVLFFDQNMLYLTRKMLSISSFKLGIKV